MFVFVVVEAYDTYLVPTVKKGVCPLQTSSNKVVYPKANKPYDVMHA